MTGFSLLYRSGYHTMLPHPDDQELLCRFEREESRNDAFGKIVAKYQEKLYWHIRRLVVDHEDANDVLQNTLLKAWNGLPGFRQDSKLYTWLYRIATNESLAFLDQKKRKEAVPLDDVSTWLSEKLIAEQGFDPQKLEWKIQMAIHKLPEKQRLVFNLRYFDEMPYEEMSQVLGTSVGGLKASYHHAVKKVEEFILKD
jgi:RNA polymerase sigma-70 factor (ECF subfamily)